mmetsp:Transcript_28928/g.38434  ORF Transcript_28928/g.38434 Transcript_28928/m.38434 type:complete len:100 (+) Transcript_28928:492-791(+)
MCRAHHVFHIPPREGGVSRPQHVCHGRAHPISVVQGSAALAVNFARSARAGRGIGVRLGDARLKRGEDVVQFGRRGSEAFRCLGGGSFWFLFLASSFGG